ncbi:MAG: hypothetical protein IMHGJWDQ_001909 [Candidatus Fervidibacter sp.]
MERPPEGEGKPEKGQGREQRFLVAPETELELLRARQRLAITFGILALVLLLTGGAIAFLLLQRYRQGLVQTPLAVEKPAPALVQTPVSPSLPPNIAQAPQQLSPSTSLVQTPPPPPVPMPVQTVKPTVPQSAQSAQPAIPPGLTDYLEQLRRIEEQRKREASNLWIALHALMDLLKAMQGVAASGDILDAPNYDPQKSLQAYDAYQQRFTQLRQWLHQLQPPPECMQLHHAYDQALLAHINAIASLKQRIATKDLAGAALGGLTFQRQIDNALGVADKELAAVCQRYGISKFFTIGDISIPRWSD